MKDNFLGGYADWKTRKYYVCQEGGMQLWMALERIKRTGMMGIMNKSIPITTFPYELTTNCKCSHCRYTRWRKKKAKELDAT